MRKTRRSVMTMPFLMPSSLMWMNFHEKISVPGVVRMWMSMVKTRITQRGLMAFQIIFAGTPERAMARKVKPATTM